MLIVFDYIFIPFRSVKDILHSQAIETQVAHGLHFADPWSISTGFEKQFIYSF